MDIVSVCHEISCNKGKLFDEIREVFRFSQCNELKIHILLIKNMCMNLGIFNTLVAMHKNSQIQILIIVSALPTLIFTNGLQQQQHLALGQAPEESVAGEQTVRSAFDTFVSSEPGGYGIYEDRKSNVFKPGETFLLYIEPLGYTYGTVTDEDGNRLYT